LFNLVGEWKADIHDVMDRLAAGWNDGASRALDSYLNNQVDTTCFDALEKKCVAVSAALRAMAEARDAFAQSIDDAIKETGLATAAAVVLGVAGVALTAYATGGTGTGFGVSIAVAAVTPVITSFVSMTYNCWGIYEEFVSACGGQASTSSAWTSAGSATSMAGGRGHGMLGSTDHDAWLGFSEVVSPVCCSASSERRIR
jgi:hypothetical protein